MIQIVLLRKGVPGFRDGHNHPRGFPTGLSVENSDVLFTNLGHILERLAAHDPDNLKNVFYCVAHHSGYGGPVPSRTKETFEYQTILPFDIDYIDNNRQWDYLPIVANILGCSPQSLIFSSTGNGLHIISHLKAAIRSNKYLEETKPHYNEVVYRINAALKDAGLPGSADPSIYDAPRILRLPNTINDSAKKGVKESKLLHYPGLVPLDLDIRKLSGLDEIAITNLSPAQIKKQYPKPDFQQVMSQCEFMKWFAEHPEQVHEPHFMAAVGILGTMSPGDKAHYEGEDRSAKDIAERIYNKASSSKSLGSGDFDRKYEHGIHYGAPKCSTISNVWPGGCEKCPHFNKITIPLQLKSEDHISSASNGYWVHGKNGPLHPHYSDLAKVYRREQSFVTCEPDRIFTFKNTHYLLTGPLTVKNWLEKKVGYEDHIREAHRTEFIKKILVGGMVSIQEEANLFEQTIKGKLNCINGVIDIRASELIPHAPSMGFKYVLPYEYVSDQVSEFFLDWLAEVTQNRTELMDAILDMMAYCLWPSYDDHVFAYLIGEGRNGKSTLLHIIQELLGRQNYSAISLSQLGGNRFAPAALEGKLANLSEESSGADLGFDELNILKDLSAGGEIQVENKGEKGFMLRNQAKLIFSANKTPRFHESGRAIRSRLLVIPFDHTFEKPDPRVEDRLISEVPKIASMLVRRIQENVSQNGGKFKVYRGGQTVAEAQQKVLLSGNSVIEWARENLESSISLPDDKCVACKDTFEHYTQWCAKNNFKAVNSHNFGYVMLHGGLTTAVTESIVKKIGGKSVRVYPHTQWKDEA